MHSDVDWNMMFLLVSLENFSRHMSAILLYLLVHEIHHGLEAAIGHKLRVFSITILWYLKPIIISEKGFKNK